MRRMKMTLIASALLALGSAAAAAERMAADVALTQATIIDVASGRLIQGKSVVLKGDTIIAVVDDKALKNYAPKHTYKLKGKYLMPGLWDSHVHFGGGPALIEENELRISCQGAH